MTSKIYNWVQDNEEGNGFIAISPQTTETEDVLLRYTDEVLRIIYKDGCQLNLPTPPESLKTYLEEHSQLLVVEMDGVDSSRTYYAKIIR